MAVLRESQAVPVATQDTRRLATPDVGVANAQPNATVEYGDKEWRSRLISGITSNIGEVLNKMADIKFENLYLEGAAQAGQLESEDQLETDPLTKDWKIAGYRDTMAKLHLADAEAQLKLDMKELRQKSPGEMSAYLKERRQRLSGEFTGLSRKERSNAFGQLLLNDRAAQALHTAEHRAWIIDQRLQASRTQIFDALDKTSQARKLAATGKLDVGEYQKILDAAGGVMYSAVWEDPALPDDVKRKFTVETLQQALQTDGIDLYNALADKKVRTESGAQVRLFDTLDGEDAVKLSKEYRTAWQRTQAERNGVLIADKAQTEALFASGKFVGTWKEVQEKGNTYLVNGIIDSPSGLESFYQKFFAMSEKGADAYVSVQALGNNDTLALTHLGKTPEAAVRDVRTVIAKEQWPFDKQFGYWAQAMNNGSPLAAQELGALIGPSLMQLSRADGTIEPQHQQILTQTFNSVRAATEAGKTATVSNLLSGLSEPQRERFQLIRGYMEEEGRTMSEAMQFVHKQEEMKERLGPAGLAAVFARKEKEVSEGISTYSDEGLLRRMWRGISAPIDTILGDETVKEHTAFIMRREFALEATAIGKRNPWLSSEKLLETAEANVMSRTLETKHGPVILPRGMTAQKYFGLPNIPNDVIADSIGGLLKPTLPGGKVLIEAGQGGVMFFGYNKEGQRTDQMGRLTPEAVRAAVDEHVNNTKRKQAEVYGPGKTVGTSSTGKVNFNGENTAGADERLMMRLRENLIRSESVIDTPKPDPSGKINKKTGKPVMNVGVAVTDENEWYPKVGPDGKVSQEEISKSFRKASDVAATAGLKVQAASGLRSDAAFLLFSEVAYQAGANFLALQKSDGSKPYVDMVEALRGRNAKAAQDAFKRSPAYFHSHPSRRKTYLDLIEQAAKG